MKNAIIAFVLVTLCGVAAVTGGLVASHRTSGPLTGSFEPPFSAFSTTSVESVTTTSQTIAATSTSRRLLTLQNIGPTTVYCAAGVTAVDQTGFFLAASSTVRFPTGEEAVYTGAVNCIASSTTKLLVSQL